MTEKNDTAATVLQNAEVLRNEHQRRNGGEPCTCLLCQSVDEFIAADRPSVGDAKWQKFVAGGMDFEAEIEKVKAALTPKEREILEKRFREIDPPAPTREEHLAEATLKAYGKGFIHGKMSKPPASASGEDVPCTRGGEGACNAVVNGERQLPRESFCREMCAAYVPATGEQECAICNESPEEHKRTGTPMLSPAAQEQKKLDAAGVGPWNDNCEHMIPETCSECLVGEGPTVPLAIVLIQCGDEVAELAPGKGHRFSDGTCLMLKPDGRTVQVFNGHKCGKMSRARCVEGVVQPNAPSWEKGRRVEICTHDKHRLKPGTHVTVLAPHEVADEK